MKTSSNRQNFPLYKKNGVKESNGIVKIFIRSSPTAISAR